jgi:hypothetical protein
MHASHITLELTRIQLKELNLPYLSNYSKLFPRFVRRDQDKVSACHFEKKELVRVTPDKRSESH